MIARTTMSAEPYDWTSSSSNVPFLKNRPIASSRSFVTSEPRVGFPPNGDISVKSSV